MAAGRICYLVNAFERDAPTRLCLEVAKGAAAAGHEVRFVAWSRGGLLDGQITEAGLQPMCVYSSVRRFRRELLAFKPDLVHTILTRPTIYGAPIAQLCRAPAIVATHHGAHEWNEKSGLQSKIVPVLYRWAAKAVTRFVAVSGAAGVELTERGGVRADRIRVIPNGVDTQGFVPQDTKNAEMRSQLFPGDASENFVVIGSAGNLRQVKGYDRLIDAAARVHQNYPQARFVVWGEGPMRQVLQQRIAGLNLQAVFKLPGELQDMRAGFAACDLYVQPSRRESFGLATAEAMASGVPVIVAKSGGLPELVDGAGIVAGDGPEGLADAIVSVINDLGLRERLAAAGRLRIVEHFTLESMISKHIDLYGELLAGAAIA